MVVVISKYANVVARTIARAPVHKYKDKDIDVPVEYCPVCKCGIWCSMISGRLLPSCNCKEAHAIASPYNKTIEAKGEL